MQYQYDLNGQRLEITPDSKDSPAYKGVCCKSCFFAKGNKCVCKCKGEFHAKGNLASEKAYDKTLSESEAKRFRDQYTKFNCICGYDVAKEPIRVRGQTFQRSILYYVPHSSGWRVAGETEKAWLYIHCPKCHYDISLWKLGVSRE